MKPEVKQSELAHIRRGLGFACGYKNIGFLMVTGKLRHTIELFGDSEIEKAVLYHAGAEVGQGAHTVFLQFAAESRDT